MENKRTSAHLNLETETQNSKPTGYTQNGLLWFGAAISIAEILTGTLLAPLGFEKAAFAIVLGHLIGGGLLYLAALIGAQSGRSSMESCRIAFGEKGSYLFSILNVLQLIGWTAVMIIGGAKALSGINTLGISSSLWAVLIGALIGLWIILGPTKLGKLNLLAVGGLFVLTLILSLQVFSPEQINLVEGTMSFGTAVELSVAMPLSWLPLIADYTRTGKNGRGVSLISVAAYSIGSTWMYLIGLGLALFAASTDFAQILVGADLGLAAILIVVLSTVTTTFLDAFSAGMSMHNMSKKLDPKYTALGVTLVGTLIAIFTPIESYQNFLYFIGSVFAPMVAILLTYYYVLKRKDSHQVFNIINLGLWLAGFILYRQFMTIDTPLGSTVPVMMIIGCLTYATHKLMKTHKENDYVNDHA